MVVAGGTPVLAAPVVDIDRDQRLGTVTTGAGGKFAYFSLGNGRAIRFSVHENRLHPVVLKNMLPETISGSRKLLPVKRRNLKW